MGSVFAAKNVGVKLAVARSGPVFEGGENEVSALPDFQPHALPRISLVQSVGFLRSVLVRSDKPSPEFDCSISVAGFNVFRRDDLAIAI
jgi:hypothetical protein